MNENPIGYEKIPKLLKQFAIPSIVATLVSSLYNIVDQVFIGQGVGYLGNAATNVSYPLSTICLAISLLLGIGSAARFSICLGKGESEQAADIAGNGIALMFLIGICYLILGELFFDAFAAHIWRDFTNSAICPAVCRDYTDWNAIPNFDQWNL